MIWPCFRLGTNWERERGREREGERERERERGREREGEREREREGERGRERERGRAWRSYSSQDGGITWSAFPIATRFPRGNARGADIFRSTFYPLGLQTHHRPKEQLGNREKMKHHNNVTISEVLCPWANRTNIHMAQTRGLWYLYKSVSYHLHPMPPCTSDFYPGLTWYCIWMCVSGSHLKGISKRQNLLSSQPKMEWGSILSTSCAQ